MIKTEIKCAIELKTIIIGLILWRMEHERQSEKRVRALCFFL